MRSTIELATAKFSEVDSHMEEDRRLHWREIAQRCVMAFGRFKYTTVYSRRHGEVILTSVVPSVGRNFTSEKSKTIYRVAQSSEPLPNSQKMVLNRIKVYQ